MSGVAERVDRLIAAHEAGVLTDREYITAVECALFVSAVMLRVGFCLSLSRWPMRYDRLSESFTAQRFAR